MRYIKYGFLAALGIALITLALANRGLVTLRLLPEELQLLPGSDAAIELPLFVVIFAGIIAGLLIGFVWEWLREHRLRAEAARVKREAAQLKQEVNALKGGEAPKDEVLALLEEKG